MWSPPSRRAFLPLNIQTDGERVGDRANHDPLSVDLLYLLVGSLKLTSATLQNTLLLKFISCPHKLRELSPFFDTHARLLCTASPSAPRFCGTIAACPYAKNGSPRVQAPSPAMPGRSMTKLVESPLPRPTRH